MCTINRMGEAAIGTVDHLYKTWRSQTPMASIQETPTPSPETKYCRRLVLAASQTTQLILPPQRLHLVLMELKLKTQIT